MKKQTLDNRTLSLLASIFKDHPKINKVVLFGSRAKGTAKRSSDIDLAIEGISDDLQLESLALELDDLPLPYKFDVKSFAGISNVPLKEHIDRVGTIIYPKQDENK